MSHRLPADQFVVGLVLNVLVLGVVGFLASELEPQSAVVDRVEIPLLASIPLIGPALFDQPWVFYLIYPVIPFIWWLLYRTRWGLEVRAVGEDLNASDVSGLHVNRLRRQTIYLTGALAGLGGGYFLFARSGRFEDSLIGGYIAIAAVIFGGWTLKGTVAGCVLFGLVASFADHPLSRLRGHRPGVPGHRPGRGDDRRHGRVRQAGAPAGGAGPAVRPGAEVTALDVDPAP